MTSLVVQLLAERSPAELEDIRDRLQADLTRTTVELEQVEAAIKQQNRSARKATVPRRGPGGKDSTRDRIYAIVAASDVPIGPAAIKRALEAEGGPVPRGGGIYAAVQRMTQQGRLRKIADGQYTLPSRNGTETVSANGHTAPETTDLAGGYGRESALTPADGSG